MANAHEKLETRVSTLESLVSEMSQKVSLMSDTLFAAVDDVKRLQELMGATDESEPFGPEIIALRTMLEGLRERVEGRNKSAPVKRNMTDPDALRVLTGDLKDLTHKEAAAIIGLTYAQVYSCRMEFTFKHVHKELRDQKWKNPWAK